MIKDLEKQKEYIKQNFPSADVSTPISNDNLIIYIQKEEIVEFVKFLRDSRELSFKILLDVFGADFLGVKPHRFEVIYNLLSLKLNNRITVKVKLDDGEDVKTVSTIFSTANWFEREAFDMYGITFKNLPDLRRILTDYDFEGYPLRKDFPLTGYKEVRYDNELKKVVYQPVELMQEYRNFDLEMPWQGTNYNKPKNS
jgi:NADH-quinone oxidoreductase subunit C